MTEDHSDHRSRSPRRVASVAVAVLAVAVSLAVTACGGSSKVSSTTAAPSSSTSTSTSNSASAVTTIASAGSATTRTIVAPPSTSAKTSTTSTTQTPKPTTKRTGGESSAVSISAGKTIFETTCGGCHTLADAHTAGSEGPNLDQLKPSDALVTHQVINGGGPMPAFGKTGQLSMAQIADVAKYVSSVAGKS